MTYQYFIDGIAVQGELTDYPDTTFGQTVTFEFFLNDATEDTDGWGTQAWGTSEWGSPTTESRYDYLKDLLNYAGYANVNTTLGSVYYTEPASYDRSTIDTLLVDVQPGDSVQQARGVWGIVVGGTDPTEIFGAQARIDIEIFVLAEYDEFVDKASVEAEFKKTV